LQIEIRGNALERLLNQINDTGIILWDVQRIEKDYYLAKLYCRDFKYLRRVLRKRHCWVKIRDKHGFPFVFNKILSRKFLVIGIALFLVIFYIGSFFLFFIKIEGLEEISEARIYDILFQNGIRRGIMKKAINTESLEKTLLKEVPQIAWVDVSWQGTCLYLEIVEKKIVEETGAGDIVAARDGIIKEVIVLKGMAVVKEGDTVTSGQPLIIATADQKRARGIVKAYVWYEGEADIQLFDREFIFTGREKTYWGFKVGREIIWLPPYQEYFKNYQKRREIKTIPVWRNIAFSIELIKEEHKEIKVIKKRYTRENALFLAKEKALQGIFTRLSPEATILDIKVEEVSQETGNGAKVRVIVKALENIAKLD
jgi:similar to stage IV sporulation protein